MIGMGVVVVMVVVAGFAGVAGFVIGRSRVAVAEERAQREGAVAEQMRRERDTAGDLARQERDTAVEQARKERDAAVEQARRERDAAVEEARREREGAAAQVQALQQQVREAGAARASAEAELVAARERFAEQVALLREEHTVREKISAEVSKQVGADLIKRFTDLNDQRAQATAREMDQRRESIDALVKPVSAAMEKVAEQMQQVEKDRIRAHASLTEQMQQMCAVTEQSRAASEEMRKETQRLVQALRRPEARGQWGEKQLRSVLEAAGMVDQINFVAQQTFTTEEGVQRPDMVVQIGGGMSVVIDSKAPFGAFIEAQDARDDAERKQRLSAHATNVRRHIDQLAKKEYWRLPTQSPELVVMFMPSDVFLFAALEQDPSLWAYAESKKVVLTTPSALMALLRSIAAVVRQDAAVANLQKTVEVCQEMTKRLGDFVGHLAKLRTNLDKTVTSFNEAAGSLERRVLPQARRVNELQGKQDTIPEIPVAHAPRQLAIPSEVTDADSTSAA
ncbi:DNA recombination protein RmuC (plasmid) [Nocardia farcinica]|nr:DNA recombination protein RmuC [Nocardia farcinica]